MKSSPEQNKSNLIDSMPSSPGVKGMVRTESPHFHILNKIFKSHSTTPRNNNTQ